MSIVQNAVDIVKRGFNQDGVGIVKHETGKLQGKSGDATTIKWSDAKGTTSQSTLVASIQSHIANDIASQEFTHVKVDAETGVESNRLDSPIYDVLNTRANNERSNFDFWTKAIKRMLTSGYVFIKPHYKGGSYSSDGLLTLEILDAEPDKLRDIIVLKSPFDIGVQQQQVMNKLFEVMSHNFNDNDIKGLLQVNGIVDDNSDKFNQQMESTLNTLYKYADDYKIGILDLKTEYTELNNDYKKITTEEVDLIRSEIYATFAMNPNIISGNYTTDELKAYKMAVIEPINKQIVTELNRVLLSDYLRVVTSGKSEYERISIYNDPFKYLSGSEIALILGQMTNAGISTRNELRKLTGLRPTDNGEEIITNLNNVRIPSNDSGNSK